ncbi:MAG: cytochrome b [Gammaproteobacteria bacterium]
MSLTNTTQKFGVITRLLHWSIFGIFVLQFFLVYRREYFPEDAPEKLQYILLHKSLGVVVLVLALFMIFWRHLGKRPAFVANMSRFEKKLAGSVHVLLYILMLAMPLTGIAMSMYSGYGVSVFGQFNLPMLVQKNKEIASIFYEMHVWISYAVIGIVGLHILGALIHHFIRKDETLKRMI